MSQSDFSTIPHSKTASIATGGDPAWARSRRRIIWGSWAALVLALTLLSLFYCFSLKDAAQKSAWKEGQAAARMLQWQMQSQIQHLDDVLLHTCESFERLGASMTEKDALFKGRTASTQLPYDHLFILGPAGESMLSLPAGTSAWGQEEWLTQARQHPLGHIFTSSAPGKNGPGLARVLPVWSPQGEFKGAVVGILPMRPLSQWLTDTSQAYGLSVTLNHQQQPVLSTATTPVALRDLEFVERIELPELDLTLDTSLSQAATTKRWSTAWQLLMLMLIITLITLTAGAIWLSRVLTRQVNSAAKLQSEKESAQVRARLLANMSHELRTPLMGVLGASELLEHKQLPPEQARFVRIIQNSGQHLLGLLNNVLDFARLDAHAMPLDAQTIELLPLLEEVSQTFCPHVELGQIDFYSTLDIPEGLEVKIDGFRLTQVLTNLLGNAFKFTKQGWVRLHAQLSTQDDAARLSIKITDTGIGISEPAQQRLFQPFEQADTGNSRQYGGTGLGLVIVKQLVELMGGAITMRSTEGLGTEFEIELPITIVQPAAAPSKHPQTWHVNIVNDLLRSSVLNHLQKLGIPYCTEPAGLSSATVCVHDGNRPNQPAHPHMVIEVGTHPEHHHDDQALFILEPSTRKQWNEALTAAQQHTSAITLADAPAQTTTGHNNLLRVLLAEDNPISMQILQSFLKDMEIEADYALNGAIALDYWRKNKYDLVILDCHMPVMDGFEVSRKIRAEEPSGQRQKVVALTAATLDEDVTSCLSSGMDAVWPKPISRHTLTENIQSLLQSVPH